MNRPVAKLMIAVCAMSFVWLIVLPWCAQLAPLREHIDNMESRGIEVDAMFYTELNWEPPSFHAPKGELEKGMTSEHSSLSRTAN